MAHLQDGRGDLHSGEPPQVGAEHRASLPPVALAGPEYARELEDCAHAHLLVDLADHTAKYARASHPSKKNSVAHPYK